MSRRRRRVYTEPGGGERPDIPAKEKIEPEPSPTPRERRREELKAIRTEPEPEPTPPKVTKYKGITIKWREEFGGYKASGISGAFKTIPEVESLIDKVTHGKGRPRQVLTDLVAEDVLGTTKMDGKIQYNIDKPIDELTTTDITQLGWAGFDAPAISELRDQQIVINEYVADGVIKPTDKGYDIAVPLESLTESMIKGLETIGFRFEVGPAKEAWTVNYSVGGVGKTATFDTEEKARTFMSNLETEAHQQREAVWTSLVGSPVTERELPTYGPLKWLMDWDVVKPKRDVVTGGITYTIVKPVEDISSQEMTTLGSAGFTIDPEWAKTGSQLKSLIASGLIKKSLVEGEYQYSVTKPVQFLTDKEEESLRGVGFEVPFLEETLSWKLWEEGEELPTYAVGAFGVEYSPRGLKRAGASLMAGIELFLSQVLGLTEKGESGAGVRGERTPIQEAIESLDIQGKQWLNVDFMEQYMPNISVGDAYAAKSIAYGVGAGLNIVAMEAIAIAVGGAVGSVGTLLADTLKTPIGKAGITTRIGSAISRLPGGQAALSTLGGIAEVMKPIARPVVRVAEIGVMAGLPIYFEKIKIKEMKKAGYTPSAIAGHVFIDVVGMIGFADGMRTGLNIGKKLYSRGKYFIQGGKVITAEEVIPDYILRREGRFPSFKAEEMKPSAKNYISLAEKYAPDEMRLYTGVPSWSGSKDPFYKVFGTRVGLNHREEAGMFFSFGPSVYFLRLGDDAAYSLLPGLPRFSASPQFVYSEFPKIIKTNLSKKAVGGMGELLQKLQGTGTLVMPAAQWSEANAILSGGTMMVEVATGNFWLNYKGNMIKIGRYLPEITANAFGIDYIAQSVQTLDELMSSLSSGGVIVNPSTYLPTAFPLVPGFSYPKIEDLVIQVSNMTSSELKDWASSASAGELYVMTMILSSSTTDISYTTALSLAAPTIISEYSELSSSEVSSKSNLTTDYGSYISDSLTGDLTYEEPSPPPSPSYTPPPPPPDYEPPPPSSYEPPPPPSYVPSPPKDKYAPFLPPRVPRKVRKMPPKRKPPRVPISEALEPYKVTFLYFMDTERFKVQAKSFHEALGKVWRRRKTKEIPGVVDIEKMLKKK